MADNSTVDRQIIDSITQTDISVLGSSPAEALSLLYQIASHANGIALQNAVNSQNNLNVMNPAIITRAIKILK